MVRAESGAGTGALIERRKRAMGLQRRLQSLLAARRAPVVALLGLFAISVLYYWNGFGSGDEGEYAQVAMCWLSDGPHLAETHWGLRQLLVLPMAASFAAFGLTEFAATVPNILYALGLVGGAYWFARRYIGEAEAFATAAAIAVSCFFVARPIEVDVYGAEAFFAVAAVWLFVASRSEARPLRWLFSAGVAGGLAFTIRETSASIAIALAVLTLMFQRQRFFSAGIAIALGYFGVIAIEMAAYALASGDPLYRYKIDFGHKEVGAAAMHEHAPSGLTRFLLPFKDIAMAPSLTPFLGVACASIAFATRFAPLSARAKSALAVFAIAGGVALVVSAWGLKLAMPHYYPIFAYAVFVAIGVALASIWRRYGAIAVTACFAALVALNIVAEDFRDYDDWAEARVLVWHASDFGEPILTDYATGSRARLMLQMRGASAAEATQMIRLGLAPEPGALYFRAWGSGLAAPADGQILAEFSPLRSSPVRETLRRFGLGGDPQSRLGRILADRPKAAFMRIPPHAEEAE
jgi:hypothetical protein